MESDRSSAKRRRIGRGGVRVAASAALVFLAVGCGKQEDEQASGGAGAGQAVLVAQSSTPVETSRGTGQAEAVVAPGEGIAAVSADSLPPDVAATVADTLVYPGGSVEITAAGSPDVVGVTLSDGAGGKQPFAYEAGTDTWRVFYRVPMKASTDRVALSVTAKNAAHRWRRVWLFLTVQREAPGAQPDSSAKP
jgi:hypothetical protein